MSAEELPARETMEYRDGELVVVKGPAGGTPPSHPPSEPVPAPANA